MATGESYHSMAFHFRIGVTTVSDIIKETTHIIWQELSDKYIPFPMEELIRKSEQEFCKR